MENRRPTALLRAMDGLGDLLRLLALAGIVLAGARYGWSAAVVFVVVFGVVLVPRIAALPRPVDVAVGITWLLAGWANVAGWYLTVDWIDIPIHVVTPGATAAAVYLLLARLSLVPPLQERRVRSAALVLLTFALGTTLAVLWEFYEWLAYAGPSGPPVVGYDDTIGDLFNGCLGSLAAGIGLAAWARLGRGSRRIPLDRGFPAGRSR